MRYMRRETQDKVDAHSCHDDVTISSRRRSRSRCDVRRRDSVTVYLLGARDKMVSYIGLADDFI
jgi:hypothetical protein